MQLFTLPLLSLLTSASKRQDNSIDRHTNRMAILNEAVDIGQEVPLGKQIADHRVQPGLPLANKSMAQTAETRSRTVNVHTRDRFSLLLGADSLRTLIYTQALTITSYDNNSPRLHYHRNAHTTIESHLQSHRTSTTKSSNPKLSYHRRHMVNHIIKGKLTMRTNMLCQSTLTS